MSRARLDEFVAAIRAQRPACCSATRPRSRTSRGTRKRRGVAMDDLGIKVAFVTSERLYDDQRDAHRARVRLPRGQRLRRTRRRLHRARMPGGQHARHRRGHRRRDSSTRRTAASPAGNPGEIVVTHLATRDFPFIRYRTGDVGVLGTAAVPCGRGLPMLEQIQGRTTDFVVAADGTVMHGLALIYVVRDLPGIESFKIVQETAGAHARAARARRRASIRGELGADPRRIAARDSAQA